MIIKRFIRIRQELMRVADDKQSDIDNDITHAFLNWCNRYNTYMIQIDKVTKYLQTSCQPFELTRLAIDTLLTKIQDTKNIEGRMFYKLSSSHNKFNLMGL